jgi:hypothetical protein
MWFCRMFWERTIVLILVCSNWTVLHYGKWFHGVDDYYKEWCCTAGTKKEGVTGLAIFEPLDRLTDGFGCSDGLRWVQDRLDEPVVPFPTTI